MSRRDAGDVCLLWIKGGAGKGKSMISIGLIERLSLLRDKSNRFLGRQNSVYVSAKDPEDNSTQTQPGDRKSDDAASRVRYHAIVSNEKMIRLIQCEGEDLGLIA